MYNEIQNDKKVVDNDEKLKSTSVKTLEKIVHDTRTERKDSQLALSSLSLQSLKQCALNPSRPVFLDNFNVVTKGASMDVRDQGETGLCWIHSGLMYLESRFQLREIDKRNSLSPHYLAFYDKLEKSLVFLKKIKEEKDPRIRYHLLNDEGPILTDGGNWGMFLHLINKYDQKT